MKKYCLLGLALVCAFILTSCISVQNYPRGNLMKETWIPQLNSDPGKWLYGADYWFLNGEPNGLEHALRRAPIDTAMTSMMVRVSDFNSIYSNGSYQVQIIGGQDRTSVEVLGPNAQTSQMRVEIRNRTLIIRDSINCGKASKNPCIKTLDKVIVRVLVHNLNNITNYGNGNVYARGVLSDHLTVTSAGGGSMMLSGDMNIPSITQTGSGTVTVIGVASPIMDVTVKGKGSVKAYGHIGLRVLKHYGSGKVNIIGADTDCLNISTNGSGITTVIGHANVKTILASDTSRVYLYWVDSENTKVYIRNKACVALAGRTRTLHVSARDFGNFFGQYLCTKEAYVITRNEAHANAAATDKMFAAAFNNSTIYFFGAESKLSPYSKGPTIVVPIPSDQQIPPHYRWKDNYIYPANKP